LSQEQKILLNESYIVRDVGNENHSGSSKPSNSIYDSLKMSKKKIPNTNTNFMKYKSLLIV
jgi:hypothetical protein